MGGVNPALSKEKAAEGKICSASFCNALHWNNYLRHKELYQSEGSNANFGLKLKFE